MKNRLNNPDSEHTMAAQVEERANYRQIRVRRKTGSLRSLTLPSNLSASTKLSSNNNVPREEEKVAGTFKVMLLGDSAVGKTCLLVRFRDGTFLSGTFIATVGIDFRNKLLEVDGAKVKLQIWDTAGQERFRSVTHAYYRDAHALLLLYDVTNRTSYDNTRAWLAEISEYANQDVIIMLIGNKCDCSDKDRAVKPEDGERLANEYQVAFMETSAKTGVNVDAAFQTVARALLHKLSLRPQPLQSPTYVPATTKTTCACPTG